MISDDDDNRIGRMDDRMNERCGLIGCMDRSDELDVWIGRVDVCRCVNIFVSKYFDSCINFLNCCCSFDSAPLSFIRWPSVITLPAIHPVLCHHSSGDSSGALVIACRVIIYIRQFIRCFHLVLPSGASLISSSGRCHCHN